MEYDLTTMCAASPSVWLFYSIQQNIHVTPAILWENGNSICHIIISKSLQFNQNDLVINYFYFFYNRK